MNNYSIAVIDDSLDDCLIIQRQLSRDDHDHYTTQCFNTYDTGLNAIASNSFDLYFIDLDLNGRSGLDLLAQARELNIQRPLVIVTGNENPAVDMKALELGATDFINKNELNAQTLSRTVRHAVTRKAHELRLEHAANHDGLTGLAHKSHFHSELERALARHHRSQTMLSVALLDLNAFKPINDTHGHLAGDHVLQTIAQRLNALVRSGDLVGRLGGDEFGILLENIESPDQLTQLFEQIDETLAQPFEFQDQTLQVSCSLGAAYFPSDGLDAAGLIEAADQRMYSNKNRLRTPAG